MSRPRERAKSGIRFGPRTIKMIAKIMISSGNPILNIGDIISKINYTGNTNPLSIYIHIPFCRSKCTYCDFNSYAIEPSKEYFRGMTNDIALSGEVIKREISTIYIGGGTPSIVPPEFIEMTLNQIYRTFRVKRDAEITMEVNPESLTLEKAKIYRRWGVNRISAGIQSFNEKVLRALGRAGGVEDNIKLFKTLREAGFENISADLMYGLKGQTLDEWMDDLKTLTQFNPDHISPYMLTPPEGVKKVPLSSEERCRRMLLTSIEFLEAKGWKQYEISNYSKKGAECRHNLNYWNWGEYIGFGAGAHSFLKGNFENNFMGIRWWNTGVPFKFYSETMENRIDGYEYISKEMALEEFIMLGLRKREGIELSELQHFLSIETNELISRLNPLILEGLLIYEGDRIKLTVNGIAVSNAVITEIWSALSELSHQSNLLYNPPHFC